VSSAACAFRSARLPDAPGGARARRPLKDLGDAIDLRSHVLRRIEVADAAPKDARRRLTFVFAGFAGVETLAAGASFRRQPLLVRKSTPLRRNPSEGDITTT
jgi:NADH dehydrogenase FAD-containing subunit